VSSLQSVFVREGPCPSVKFSPLPPLRLYGGKGGVGKTTCAAAAALIAAEKGRRVLACSTDPAHSLGDALRSRLAAEPSRVPTRRGTLLAAELAAGPALDRWRTEHRHDLRQIAARGTYLDEEDVERFLDLSLPGADELMAWLDLSRLAHATDCDEIVVDAAPTAHTLRLLAMPEALQAFAEALDRLQERHRLMAERFRGAWQPDASDAMVADLATAGREIAEALRDPERAALSWVLLPEALSVAETRDALAALDAAGLTVREVIVNRVLPPGEEGCPLCRERGRAEAEAIAEIQRAFAQHTLRFLPEEEREPRGRVALRKVARWLEGPPARALTPGPSPDPSLPPSPGEGEGPHLPDPPLPKGEEGERQPLSSVFARVRPCPSVFFLDDLLPPTLRLLFFGGKGGVGKTTCAAAVALALAERRPAARILLLSTDPAHSVADVLGVPLGDDERQVPGAPPGFHARELDSQRAFEAWRDRHGEAFGEADISDFLDLTPPGLDELIALSTLLDAVAADEGTGAFDLVVVDTAPTGHALRLLEMPELALRWDHYLLSLLLKYREAVGLGGLAGELVELSRSLKRLQSLLHDPHRARFVAVTRPGELPRRETLRLLRALGKLAIEVPAVIVNALAPAGCVHCGGSPGELQVLRERLGRCVIIAAPARFPPPRGIQPLAGWVRTWERATA
jgi:arsenite/tail-anchored protein-transporting ATPase